MYTVPSPPDDECKAPNSNEGLGATLKEIIDIIPVDEILTIYIRAVSSDREVLAAAEYLESDEFKTIVQIIHDTKEFSDFMEFLCEDLHFNSYYYLNELGKILDYPLMTRPPPHKHHYNDNLSINRKRSGFKGLLQDIRDVLPLEQMKEIYKKRYESDRYLKLAVEKIGSPEFYKILEGVYELPEHKLLFDRLRRLNVDIDGIIKKINEFFGWNFQP